VKVNNDIFSVSFEDLNRSMNKMEKTNRQISDLGKFYLSQGKTKQHIPTNDCGPTAVAMIINIILVQSGIRNKKVSKKEVTSAISLIGRLPNWIPKIGGASAPWGLVKAFNQLAHENHIPWEAWRVDHANPILIANTLKKGGFISILRIWKNGGAHWSNIVHFVLKEGVIHLLDPNPYLSHLPSTKKIQVENWKTVKQDWERQPWWAKCLGIKRDLIVYQRIEQ
jgi:hypothetical protein